MTLGQALLAVTGWAAVTGASALCAAMIAKRSPLRSRWWLAGVPVLYLALIPVFTYTIGSSFLVFHSAGDPPVGFRPGIAGWTTAALLVSVGLTRLRASRSGGQAELASRSGGQAELASRSGGAS